MHFQRVLQQQHFPRHTWSSKIEGSLASQQGLWQPRRRPLEEDLPPVAQEAPVVGVLQGAAPSVLVAKVLVGGAVDAGQVEVEAAQATYKAAHGREQQSAWCSFGRSAGS